MSAPAPISGQDEKIKDAADAMKEARRGLDGVNEESRAFRAQFFDKLTLFNGACLAASVTILGFFFNHPQAKLLHRSELETAWWMMFAAMVCGLARNFTFNQYLWYGHFQRYADKKAEYQGVLAEVTQDTLSPVVDKYTLQPIDKQAETAFHNANKEQWKKAHGKALKSERFYETASEVLQYATPILTLVGLAMLVLFTVANLP